MKLQSVEWELTFKPPGLCLCTFMVSSCFPTELQIRGGGGCQQCLRASACLISAARRYWCALAVQQRKAVRRFLFRMSFRFLSKSIIRSADLAHFLLVTSVRLKRFKLENSLNSEEFFHFNSLTRFVTSRIVLVSLKSLFFFSMFAWFQPLSPCPDHGPVSVPNMDTVMLHRKGSSEPQLRHGVFMDVCVSFCSKRGPEVHFHVFVFDGKVCGRQRWKFLDGEPSLLHPGR